MSALVAPKPTTHGFPPTGAYFLPRGVKRQRNSLSFALQSFSPFSENIVEKRITTRCSATSRRYEQLEKSTFSGILNRTCTRVCTRNQIFTLDTSTRCDARGQRHFTKIKRRKLSNVNSIKALKNFPFLLSAYLYFETNPYKHIDVT